MAALRRYPLGASILLLASLGGCKDELGPERFETTRVTGVVREGGHAVGGGWIEFFPVDGAVGKLRSAPLGSDGRFVVERVAVGKNAIGLVAAQVRDQTNRRLFDTLGTPIRREIPPGAQTELTIDLMEERARHQAEIAARR